MGEGRGGGGAIKGQKNQRAKPGLDKYITSGARGPLLHTWLCPLPPAQQNKYILMMLIMALLRQRRKEVIVQERQH